MNRPVAYLIQFATMFSIVFILIIAMVAIVPLIVSFVTWNFSHFIPSRGINWDVVFMLLRIDVLISVIAGLSYLTSKDCQSSVDYMVGDE